MIEETGARTTPELRVGTLHAGFVWNQAGIALLTDHEIFDRYRRTTRTTRFRGTGKVADSGSLKPGDYCVHVDHGIARFLGLRRITADGIESECLLLEYAGGDRLYVPTDKLLLVERYDVPDDQTIQLHKLGGATWERAKKRARKAIMAVAQELLTLYASRELLPGFAFAPDNHYQSELENAFIHEETRDQIAAVEAVKRDMEQSRPMDRLVCGDVGFGKTEVAMRGAFKAVQNGKQVAVLCPTTILAEQHGETFSQRMREFPVTVEVLSRFRSPQVQKDVLKRAKEGKVDILVGTHRILSRDVDFRDLGLLVVDEEQRFGVRHKERLKEMRKQVDVLTLSATPIPRTLYLALMGARDLSIIATPPRDRLPIHTEVSGFSEELVAESLRREMHRGGQVFFVHNRVETIDAMAALVNKVVPEARVLVAHGQMGENELESIMKEFISGEADVLVTTMIIESGLDMPNVNTILIDRADRLGLSQLHQLRDEWGAAATRPTPFSWFPRTRRSPGKHAPASPRSRNSRIWEAATMWRCAIWRSVARGTSSASRSPGTSPRSDSISIARCSRRRSGRSRARGCPGCRMSGSTCGPRPTSPTSTWPIPRSRCGGTGSWVGWPTRRAWTSWPTSSGIVSGPCRSRSSSSSMSPACVCVACARRSPRSRASARGFALFSLATAPRTPVSSRTCSGEPGCPD